MLENGLFIIKYIVLIFYLWTAVIEVLLIYIIIVDSLDTSVSSIVNILCNYSSSRLFFFSF